MELPARGGIDDKSHGVNGDAFGGERFRGHDRITLAGLLAIADQNDHAFLGHGRDIVHGLPKRMPDRRVTLRLEAIDGWADRAAVRLRRVERDGEVGVLAVLVARGGLRPVEPQRHLRLSWDKRGDALHGAACDLDTRLTVRQLCVHAAGGIQDQQHWAVGGVASLGGRRPGQKDGEQKKQLANEVSSHERLFPCTLGRIATIVLRQRDAE